MYTNDCALQWIKFNNISNFSEYHNKQHIFLTQALCSTYFSQNIAVLLSKKTCELSTFLFQICEGALLNNISIFENNDLIHIARCVEATGDQQYRTSNYQLGQSIQYLGFGLDVQACGRIVQDQDRSIA